MATISSFMEHLIKGAAKKQAQQVRISAQTGMLPYNRKFELVSDIKLKINTSI